jgi:hypothetical protein
MEPEGTINLTPTPHPLSWAVAGIYTAASLKVYSRPQDVASVKALLRSSTRSLNFLNLQFTQI